MEKLPSDTEVEQFSSEPEVRSIVNSLDEDHDKFQEALHQLASKHLADGNVQGAWKTLLQS